MMKLSLLLVCCLPLACMSNEVDERDLKLDRGDHYLICEQEPIELGIVLDSSRSIRPTDFERGKQFLQDYLNEFSIGDGVDDIRVSIITFGLGIYKQDAFNLTTYTSKEDVVRAIGNVPFRSGPWTDTGKAIEFMHKHQLNEEIVRPWAAKVGLVITDGDSQLGRITNASAAAARADGINMFVIGIGNVRDQELMGIAGDRDNIKKVSSYRDLSEEKEFLAKKTCVRQIKSTTPTMAPAGLRTSSCGQINPADIEFVFSPADIGLDAVAFATSFISHTTDSKDMDVGFRYGLTTGVCPDDSGFRLNRYNNVADIDEHLKDYDMMRLPGLVEHVRDYSFSVENGGRDDSRKVAVLFLTENKGIYGGDLQGKVNDLRADGIEVFISNPEGYSIDIEGATPLGGRSSRQQSEELVSWLCPL